MNQCEVYSECCRLYSDLPEDGSCSWFLDHTAAGIQYCWNETVETSNRLLDETGEVRQGY
jgi:hypothetical protein